MAARLREAGEEVPLVVLIDTYGPDYRQLRPLVTPSIYRWLQWVRRLQMKVEQFIPWILMHWRTLSDLSWRERWQYLRYKGERRLLVTRKLINRSAQPLLSAVLNNPMDHAEMSKRTYKMYKAQTYDGKVVILRAEKQPLGILPDTYLGWRRLLTGELEVCIVPGYHDSLLFGPRVQFLAQALQSVLDREAASLI
jgi:thioesterase domain-containing protein